MPLRLGGLDGDALGLVVEADQGRIRLDELAALEQYLGDDAGNPRRQRHLLARARRSDGGDALVHARNLHVGEHDRGSGGAASATTGAALRSSIGGAGNLQQGD